MRTFFAIALFLLFAMPAAAQNPESKAAPSTSNPFFEEWKTPFATPPFERIKAEHFLPAFKEGIAQRRKEIAAITGNPDAPTFANTIEALDDGRDLLTKVQAVFGSLTATESTDVLVAIDKEVTPLLTALSDDIYLDQALFRRVKAVYDQRGTLKLDPVQAKLLEETYKDFRRSGALLGGKEQARLREINTEVSSLTLTFGNNLLKETNGFQLVIDKKEDLAGLPAAAIEAAAGAAKAAKLDGKWVFTLHYPSIWPFMTYAENRELRKKLFTAYTARGAQGNQYDNRRTLAKIAQLRAERAKLLGYPTHADYVLEENMAKAPKKVYDFLNSVWVPGLKLAKQEAADLQKAIAADGKDFKLEPWDWFYYTEKVRKARFDLDDSALRPYFSLDQVREGAFYVANKLYGITFTERKDIAKYNPEVRVFEVKDRDGSHLAVYTADYFPRPSKRGGAWCGHMRDHGFWSGKNHTPIVTNVLNFTRPTKDAPALLSMDEVRTLFHEFGHALHGFFSTVKYRSIGSVPRDFVELPSQINEHWATEPEVLKVYAKHYKTGEVIPAALLQKILDASKFDQGFKTVEYVAASLLDMDWHTISAGKLEDADVFEKASMAKIGLIPEIVPRYKSPYFNHIFGGMFSYSSGYYSYLWSEVLDSDAFEAFKEKGIFDQATASSFRNNVLAKGGTEEAMNLYVKFRGREPSVQALLKKRGLAEEAK